jgi:serine/threonine protein kinase
MSTREPVPTRMKPAVMTTTMFGRYKLLGRIGEGGMAEVYRALMTGPEGFERELVLKRILPRLSDTGDFKTMFIREAKISALLLHPNIVQIYEFGEADGAYFIAMENVQGVTLREALTTLRREQRAMPYLVAADIARQICIGLDYAHTLHGPDGVALEIVHQDISPTNIMLAYTGTVKILDFGIARAASFAEEEAKKGLIKGKVSYLSPEQINVRPFDARADVFALGVVFHEMLTGRRLFQAKNDITKMRQLLAQKILPPSAMNATIPRELDRIVMRSLSIDVNERYQTTADMASDLERTLIAARYSSRELSKLLHGLFLPDEDPLVVVDSDDHRTVAMTGSTSASGNSGSGQTGTATSSGSRTSGGTRTTGSRSTSNSQSTPGGATAPMARPSSARSSSARPTSPTDSVTEPIPDAADVRPSDSGAQRLDRVVQAEAGRLARKRMRRHLRVLGVVAAVAIIVGGGTCAVKRYLVPFVLAPPPPAPKPVLPVPMPNQTAPEPAAKPVKKKTTHKKSHAPAAEPTPAAPGDEPMPPSDSKN